MQYSPLNNIPISLGQRTPDVLKNSHRIQRSDYRGDSSLRHDTSTISHRQYIPTSSYADRSSFLEPEPSQNYGHSGLRDSRSSFQDPYSQQQKSYQAKRSEEGFSSSFSRSYQPMVSTQPVSSYISNTYEAYVSRPEGLIQLILNSYIINGGILLLTSIGFLLLSLSVFCFITQGWNFSLDTWQFLRALLFLSAILISKALMLKYYDTFVNWNDVVRDLFTSGPLFQITLFFSVFAIVAYTYDIFTFFISAKSVEEISHVLVVCIVNSIISVVRSLSNKEYLLASTSFETNWSYFSEYHPMNLFTIAVKHFGQSLKVIIISSLLCYSGLISLIFEESLSMLSYEYLQFPGLGKALVRGLIYFAGLWGANFILEVQINVMKRIWIRVLDRIGNTRHSMKSLYYFNDRTESDDVLVGHSLRFIDTKIRYECRNSLLRRQNQGDPESKTIWHVLIENTLEKLDRISSQLQTLKASRLVMSGSFGPKGHNENMLMALQYFFTSPPDVKDVRHLYHDMCVGAHQFKVVNRIFREMKILNLDVALRNFNINLQTYYQGLYNVNSILWQIKNINQSPYIDSLLTDISHFEEVTKEGLLMLNKFVALQ